MKFVTAMFFRAFCLWALSAGSLAQAQEDTYYAVFLRPDPARKQLEARDSERIQNAHMANILKMAADGVLVAAGPFGAVPGEDKKSMISGIFVMKVPSLQEAKRIAAEDPTVVEHRNSVDAHIWKGPAGIGQEYFRLHKLDPKMPEGMAQYPLFLIYRGGFGGRRFNASAHWKFLDGLRQAGKLAASGVVEGEPEMMDPELFEIVVFRPMPLEEARGLLDGDPMVRSGSLRLEPHLWWSAAHVLPWE